MNIKVSIKPVFALRKLSKNKREIIGKEVLKEFKRLNLKKNIFFHNFDINDRSYSFNSFYNKDIKTIVIEYDECFLSRKRTLTEKDHAIKSRM